MFYVNSRVSACFCDLTRFVQKFHLSKFMMTFLLARFPSRLIISTLPFRLIVRWFLLIPDLIFEEFEEFGLGDILLE